MKKSVLFLISIMMILGCVFWGIGKQPREAQAIFSVGNIYGTVFEDVDYETNLDGNGYTQDGTAYDGGTVDRGLEGVTVELYDSSGAFVTSNTTDVNGDYELSFSASDTYTVRVVSATVDPPAGEINAGYSADDILPEQTFESDGTTDNGGAGALGGNDPSVSDADTAAGAGEGDTNISISVFGDTFDVDFGFTFGVVTNTNDSGQGSLRQDIINANAISGSQTTVFNISGAGPHTIAIGSALPTLADDSGLYVNGCSQSGAVANSSSTSLNATFKISIDAQNSYSPIFGIGSSNNTIYCLNLTNLQIRAIYISGSGNTDNKIQGNYIGTDVGGTAYAGNTYSEGITVDTAGGTIIGTDGDGSNDVAERNLILPGPSSSGSLKGRGVFLLDSNNNVVAGNIIGMDAAGTNGFNIYSGVLLQNADNNRIGTNGDGTSDALERNYVTGAYVYNIYFGSGSDNTTIAGNYIGTNVSGTTGLPYNGAGPYGYCIYQYDLTTSGSTGTVIGVNGDGSAGEANEGNLISYCMTGIILSDDNVVIAGNKIGTNAAGTAGLGHSYRGISIGSNISGVRVGTNGDGVSDALERNIISGNYHGIEVEGSGHIIAGNYIGTDVNGTSAIPNTAPIYYFSAANSYIGMNSDGSAGEANEGNVISGNTYSGIDLNAANVMIAGNIIGSDPGRTIDLGNGDDGIYIRGYGDDAIIGSNKDGINDSMEANFIAYNDDAGVRVNDGALGVEITRNSFYANGGLGIDLFVSNYGVTANDAGDTDTGANNLLNFPVITTAEGQLSNFTVSGTLDIDTAMNNAVVEIYEVESTPDATGYGEGYAYLGSATPTAGGAWSTSLVLSSEPANITALTIDVNDNTSEFAANMAATVVTDTGDVITDIDVNNESPVVDSVTVAASSGGAQADPVNLTEGTTTTLYIHGEYTDNNGCGDVSDQQGAGDGGITAVLYRSGVGSSCSADNNNCYVISSSSCSITGCAGGGDVTASYECTVNVEYYADPTDAGAYAAENWMATVKARDEADADGTKDSVGFEVSSLLALDVSATLDYGSLAFNEVSTEKNLTVTNTGNIALDYYTKAEADGSHPNGAMACDLGTIPAGNQEYSLTSGFTYGNGTDLTDSNTLVNATIAARTDDLNPSTRLLYWRIQIPASGLKGTCSGTTSFTAETDQP